MVHLARSDRVEPGGRQCRHGRGAPRPARLRRRLAIKAVHGRHAADDEYRLRSGREVATAGQAGGAFTASVADASTSSARTS
ncbi:hypothetical protein BFF78_27780 [Streptomyces fodineus]|uniref:Uncharacterized protein n=1 Tax=Streptomyces fodineus TaxID=1904616 RepID=A0A1D7YFP6_9ACTN|nr:hypothetical protein [Streptomyces fodineus]AOR34346.1 hypothetical protein BFF78_27780 [Streptomyces fodineus]